MDFDARVRLTLMEPGSLPDLINQSAHDNLFIFHGGACASTNACRAERQLTFELTDVSAAPLTLHGKLSTSIVWPGEEPRAGGVAMTFSGLDGPGQAAPVVTHVQAAGPAVHLDASHPVEVHHVGVRLDPTGVADPERLAPDVVLIAKGDEPDTGTLIITVEPWSEPAVVIGRNGGFERGGPVDHRVQVQITGCDPGKPCEQEYRVTFSWKGAPDSSRTIEWAIDAGVRDYAERPSGAPVVEAEYIGGRTIPDGAPRLSRTFSGELMYSNRSDRGGGTLRVNLSAAAAKGDLDTGRVPGRVVFTWSATEGNGPRDRSDAPIRMLIQNSWWEMFAADGRPRSVSLDLLAPCLPNVACESLDFVQVFVPGDANLDYPVTVRWTAVAEVTSFSTDPFGPGADITVALEARR
jgi:hypothetical protein